jgi:hypothetical protein
MEIRRWYIDIRGFLIPTPFLDIQEDEENIRTENISYPRCEGISPAELFKKELNETTND